MVLFEVLDLVLVVSMSVLSYGIKRGHRGRKILFYLMFKMG